jgi:hypothetical protein
MLSKGRIVGIVRAVTESIEVVIGAWSVVEKSGGTVRGIGAEFEQSYWYSDSNP